MKNIKSNSLVFKGLSLILLFVISSCGQQTGQSPTPSSANDGQIERVTADPAWDKLLTRNSGWFGGDGIFAVPMDGAEYLHATDKTKTLFLFSDSVIADTVGETIEKKDFKMVHNCVAYLDGSEPDPSKFKFFINKDAEGKPTSLFVPNTPNAGPKDYYWLGDGFVNVEMDSTLYIFAYPV